MFFEPRRKLFISSSFNHFRQRFYNLLLRAVEVFQFVNVGLSVFLVSCVLDLISLVLFIPESSMKRARSQNPYAQPRSRKIRSKIGIGIPRSQSKMYPVAPACLILFVKCISDILS